MRHAPVRALAVLLLLPAADVAGAGPRHPSLVSPGSADEFAVVAGACPTFSWAAVAGGQYQELVVHEVDASGTVVADPALTVRLPAGASSWTPAAADCFARGASYAWSLRAVDDADGSEWAEARFFSVPAVPGEEELRASLEVVQAYLAAREGGAAVVDDHRAPANEKARPDEAEDAEETDEAGRVRMARSLAISSFRVGPGGAVVASSFTGDGSGLFGIGSAAIAAGAVGSSEIAYGAVGSSEIAADAVGAEEIAAGAVGASELAANAVGSSEIAAGAVTASEMAGSFCLVRKSENSCPPGYSTHFLKFDTEDTGNADICTDGVVEYSCAGSVVWLGFCCS